MYNNRRKGEDMFIDTGKNGEVVINVPESIYNYVSMLHYIRANSGYPR